MNKIEILQEIFHHAGEKKFISFYEIEILTGCSGADLRPMLEDLKEATLILEHPEGFQISDSGRDFCRSRWI
jgi:ribosomal protein S19E (S16A)